MSQQMPITGSEMVSELGGEYMTLRRQKIAQRASWGLRGRINMDTGKEYEISVQDYRNYHFYVATQLEVLTKSAKHHKLVEAHPDNDWNGLFQVNGDMCFLVTMKKFPSGYCLYATGTDDFDMVLPELSYEDAARIYKAITSGTRINKLRDFGFKS
jgi:hypothetical protein